MSNDKHISALIPTNKGQVPPPPQKCDGQLYTFFLEPTGTETCELPKLIGVDCPSAVTGVAEVIWQVPAGTLGRVFVVACINSTCAKFDEVLVVRNNT